MTEKRNFVGTYLLATVALTWVLCLPAALASYGRIPGSKEDYLGLVGLGALTPLIVASVFQKLEGQSQKELFRLHGTKKSTPLWWPTALASPAAALLLGLFLLKLVGFSVNRWFYIPVEKERLIALFIFPIGEEVGWRAFALPRLLRRFTPWRASVLLGLAWSAWHFMMFAIERTPLSVYLLSLPFFVFGSYVFTYVYQKTHGSLFAMILMHMGAHLNNSNRALPDVSPLLAHTLGFAVFSLLIVISERRAQPPKASLD